jgi:hypothetical protein
MTALIDACREHVYDMDWPQVYRALVRHGKGALSANRTGGLRVSVNRIEGFVEQPGRL